MIKNLGNAAGGGGGVNIAASNTTFTSGTVVFTGSGALTVSTGAGSIIFSVPATSSLVGVGPISVSTAGSTISVLQNPVSRFFVPEAYFLTPLSAPGNATMSIQYMNLQAPLSGSRIDALMAMSNSSSAGAGTVTLQHSRYAIIYTRNVSTLSSLSSGSTQTTYTYASNTAGATYLSNSAVYPLSVPVNFSMTPGEYYIGFNLITANTAGSVTQSMMGGNNLQSALPYADFANTATSTNAQAGMGVYTVATTGVPTAPQLGQIAQTGSSQSQANIALVFRNV